MNVEVITRYRDLEEDTVREIGETFQIQDKTRAETLIRKGFVREIKTEEEPAET